ncbi:MAG: hypothetical protein HHJ11_07600 [Phycicoccus sp.]|nr:hypothetical protein [Phycicoccus sp.]NMM34455.1 hypothetical protein [Phycicoccus sp.]
MVPVATAITPEPPGGIGSTISAEDALHYLEALGTWRDQRRAELDRLDEAALAAPEAAATPSNGTTGLTGDITLSMALWKAVADRHDLLVATWDSGRVGPAERERLSTLIWGRLDATLDPQLARRPDVPSSSGALAVSLPEAMRLSDALAASLRARLSLDPSDADVANRLKQLRAQLERVRDLVANEPPEGRDRLSHKLGKLDERLGEMVDKAKRGADVGGLVGPLEADAARAERDLIVGSATRAETARDATRAHELRAELEARGAAIRDLATRCVASVNPAPKLAVPDVAALGPVPQASADVNAYLARLATVSRALNLAHAAYATAMDERDELRGRLEAYAIKATRVRGSSSPGGDAGAGVADSNDDLDELFRRAQEVLREQPSDMVRARALVAAHQAYLASRSTTTGMAREMTRGLT